MAMKRITISNLKAVNELARGEMQNTVGGLKKSDVIRLVRAVGCFLAGRIKRVRQHPLYEVICG